MSGHEIYDLAAVLAGRIKDYLNHVWYDRSGVSLLITFSDDSVVNASASIWPSSGKQCEHRITLTYALVELIYSESFDFALFASKGIGKVPIHTIPEQFDISTATEFMFESGITFIIFHELAHINQNHGIIRTKYGSSSNYIAEFGRLHFDEKISGRLARIYHATELAADFEALNWMANFLNIRSSGIDFVNHAYLQCAIVSCIMLLFNGDYSNRLDEAPSGTHPYPIPRMDFWVRAYSERINLLKKSLSISNANHAFKLLHDAPFLATLKWMTRLQLPNTDDYSSIIRGIMSHPNHNSYMREIINTWSDIYRFAQDERKYDIGIPLSVLYFSDEYRKQVGAAPNEYNLEAHIELTIKATKRNV